MCPGEEVDRSRTIVPLSLPSPMSVQSRGQQTSRQSVLTSMDPVYRCVTGYTEAFDRSLCNIFLGAGRRLIFSGSIGEDVLPNADSHLALLGEIRVVDSANHDPSRVLSNGPVVFRIETSQMIVLNSPNLQTQTPSHPITDHTPNSAQ